MPLFLIEFYINEDDIKRGNVAVITGANSLNELLTKLESNAFDYDFAKIFILREGHYIRILTADLSEWRDIINEERQQKDNVSLHK